MSAFLDKLTFDNSFSRLGEDFYTRVRPQSLQDTHLIHANRELGAQLGLSAEDLQSEAFLRTFSGLEVPPQLDPLAMVYSGHQFGGYSPQLGDGRGLLLGELVVEGQYWDLHLKGAGRTPYSRFGDGRAVLRSSLREYLGSEALHYLGIPTTRALALFGSRQPVQRETEERGALLLRVSHSHIRFGSFEYFHYTRQPQQLQQLADHVIERHYPDLVGADDRYRRLLQRTVEATARLIALWQSVGFTHGVMNTDNMSIVGETFDYGPYGFMDDYDPHFVCNHSDSGGRYAFDQQPGIGLWNLNALAQALSTLISAEEIRDTLVRYEPLIQHHYARKMLAKLGLQTESDEDAALLNDWLQLLQQQRADYTRSFRALCDFTLAGDNRALRDQFVDPPALDAWLQRYRQRLLAENSQDAERQTHMRAHNPKYILRNYLAQRAIEQAEAGDYSEVERLLTLLQRPYEEQPEREEYARTPPDWAKGLALSCSS